MSNSISHGASLRRYRQILDSATETGIITFDRRGLVTGWSSGAVNLLGWTEEEMIGQSLARIFSSEDGGRLEIQMSDALQTGQSRHEGWRLRKDGHRIWAIGETTPLHEEDSEATEFVKILRDRTELRAAEVAQAEDARVLRILNDVGARLARESDLAELVQAVTDAGVDLTHAQFGAFFYNKLDPTGESYMLYSLSGAEAEAFSQFAMPRNTDIFAPTFAGTGIVRSDDITQDPKYGRSAPHYGMPAGHLPVRSYLAVPVISRDQSVIGGLFFGHSQPAVFNDRSERILLGLAGEAAVAIDNTRLFASAQREVGERRAAEVALRDLNSNLELLIKEKAIELEKKSEALRQSQKMEAVGQLTGGVAHDFNNLLQIIIGNLETLTRNLPENMGRLRRSAAQAMTGAKRAASLTQRLLAFSRRQPLDPKQIDVNTLVRGMSELFARTLGEQIEIETVFAGGLWRAEVDPNELENALLNLAVNARDAMPKGGKLTIETSNTHLDDRYSARHAEVTPGQYVLICVTDTGSGMDEATLSRVFEPFFTTKAEGRGTGLGLSQVYGFVKQSNGHVKLYSEIGVGTTAKIYLPRPLAEDIQQDSSDQLPVPEGTAAETILVVEDDPDVRRYSVETLQELGYSVIEAHDGPSAIAILDSPVRIDMLFTDVVLPGAMTGADVFAEAQRRRPGLKALFTTGYARNAIVHHGRLDKGLHLITKPFSFEDLAAKVRSVLDENSNGQ